MGLLKRLLLAYFLTILVGCQIPYIAKSAYHQAIILAQREPIDSVLKNHKTPPETIAKLKLATEARAFAESLGLKVGKNYTSFTQLEKPFVSYVVNASEKYQLKNYLWSFPIVGAVPYKGYPTQEEALKEAKELEKKDYDTYVRGVSAFSTLGWFADPVLSSMLRYSDADLVNTIIHESVHATLFIKSNADFNESLATFFGDHFTIEFFKKKEGENSNTVKQILLETEDQKIFQEWMSKQIQALKIFYSNLETKNEPLRQAAFQRIALDFQSNVKPFLKSNTPIQLSDKTLNNAYLSLFLTYSSDQSDFKHVLLKCKFESRCFLEKMKSLEESKDPASDLKKL